MILLRFCGPPLPAPEAVARSCWGRESALLPFHISILAEILQDKFPFEQLLDSESFVSRNYFKARKWCVLLSRQLSWLVNDVSYFPSYVTLQ
jgi:hypothetical protein